MKKTTALILSSFLFFAFCIDTFAIFPTKIEAERTIITAPADDFNFDVASAYLIEASTGEVLYAENELSKAAPASVTKVMTLLLVCEALADGKFKLEDIVSVSSHAASMGGSQVFLEEGERISVEDLIKSTVIASGNDAALALAELTAGSEAAFVRQMNEKAVELGLKNTSFENVTGLDDTTTNHYSCAADIATMSRELIKHDIILKYSSIWQDTIRDGEFTLTNTNRLVRYYDGCNGLKTGSTDKAGYCISATAKRGNMQLIAVIMGADTRDSRNAAARELFDFGFANYTLYERAEQFIENANVIGGVKDSVALNSKSFATVADKGKAAKIELIYDIPETLKAPITAGTVVGRIVYKLDGEDIGESDIFAMESIEKITLGEIFVRILKRFVLG